ncbi:DUF4868 domain-containing protein [Photobacterium damselae]|uniref:anti-phage protein KwaB n=1 Tax=Photobacterium damselae TaxID=38293 RepID=UPI0011D0614B|nr:anti-phage protein KwaB [Photobacterium damselae]KAB1506944.1 DUF4868 domain-containing protein [Photobacterium damselae subsp. damselae]
MNTAQAKRKIKEITDCCTGIKLFFIDQSNTLFDSDIDCNDLDCFRNEFVSNLKSKYVENDDFSCPTLSNDDSRKNALFIYDFDLKDIPLEFKLLDQVNNLPANKNFPIYQAKAKGLSNLKGIIIRLKNINGKVMSFYQYLHHSALYSSKKNCYLTTHKTRVVKLTHDVLRLNNKFIVAKLDSEYFIESPKLLENELGFDEILKAKAQTYYKDLHHMNLADDLEKFNGRIQAEVSFAKKFVKVFKNSAVIEQGLSTQEIIDFAMSKEIYTQKLKLTEDGTQFNLQSIARCKHFLTLLDDVFLKSELTGQDYIVKTKDRA